MGRKTFKGAVSIINDRGRIRLRWRYQTERYSINLQAHTKTNLTSARKLAVQIEQDMLNNQFDFSLSKYKGVQEAPPKVAKTMVNFFEEWVTDYKQMSCDKNSDYFYIRNTIKKWGEFKQEDLLSNLNKEAFGSKTYNSRLSILRAFAAWLVKQTVWKLNPLLNDKQADDLVFQSFTGTCIDDRMFQRRVFKPILKELKIEERVLYACRHTFGSMSFKYRIYVKVTGFTILQLLNKFIYNKFVCTVKHVFTN